MNELVLDRVTKHYGTKIACERVSLRAGPGVYGLLGANGAGKTTLLRMICGVLRPTAGSIQFAGLDVASEGYRARLGYLPQDFGYYPEFTALDFLLYLAALKGLPRAAARSQSLALLEEVGLADAANGKIRTFSGGMRQRLGIAMALAGDPDFLVLDEPTNGLDPQGIIEVRELILKLNREFGITVLISSHILGELSKLATHYGFIDGGRIVQEISAEALEAACRKCARLTVSDVRALARVLDRLGFEYQIVSETQADVFGTVNVTQLTLALAEEGCEVVSMQERDESLESYYVNLVGGARRE